MFTAVLFTTDKTWKKPKCLFKENVAYIYNAVLLSHRK